MKKYNVELDITEIVKLVSICNLAIVTEENTLQTLHTGGVGCDNELVEHTEHSLAKIREIKAKFKSVITNPTDYEKVYNEASLNDSATE